MLADCHTVTAEFLLPILLRNSPGSQNTSDDFTMIALTGGAGGAM